MDNGAGTTSSTEDTRRGSLIMQTATERTAQRRALYDAGASDGEIARIQGCKPPSIRGWRDRNGLPANPRKPAAVRIEPEREQAWRDSYAQGLNDVQIAAAVGVQQRTILKWRQRRGLPANILHGSGKPNEPGAAEAYAKMKRRCVALLERGVGALMIAREMQVPVQRLDCWRTIMLRERPELRRRTTANLPRPQWPSGRRYSAMRPERRARAFLLYADGRNDGDIALDLGVNRQQIWEWRRALSLPAIKAPPRGSAAKGKLKRPGPPISPMSNTLYAYLVAAVGRGVAPDLIDDAVSDLWLAIEEGRLTVDEVASQAGRYRNKVVATYASRFGPRSLDEEIGDGDGFRMIDLIRDDRSAAWLEEMGATIW